MIAAGLKKPSAAEKFLNLGEGKAADKKLTALAESKVNRRLVRARRAPTLRLAACCAIRHKRVSAKTFDYSDFSRRTPLNFFLLFFTSMKRPL